MAETHADRTSHLERISASYWNTCRHRAIVFPTSGEQAFMTASTKPEIATGWSDDRGGPFALSRDAVHGLRHDSASGKARGASKNEVRAWITECGWNSVHDAVRAGGGRIVPIENANVIIWVAGEPSALSRVLHSGIRWIQLSSAGVEQWLKGEVIDDGRLWTAGKGVYAEPIAEYVLAMMLASARRLPDIIQTRTWSRPGARLVAGSTAGIIGAGGIGGAVTKLLATLSVRTLALTRSGREVPWADVSLGPDGLARLLQESDYVVLAAPETSETIRLLSTAEFALMRPDAWLINVGRGSIIDTDALVEVLRSGTIGGVALDVTDPEPLPERHPLWGFPNALLTGHTACPSDIGEEGFADRVRENVKRFVRGEELIGKIDRAAGY